MKYADDLVVLTSYFTPIHHTPGRLRIAIDKKIADADLGISLDAIASLHQSVTGIREVKINKIMATATILYDPEHIAPDQWNKLIEGKQNELFERLSYILAHSITKEE